MAETQTGKKKIHYAWLVFIGCCSCSVGGIAMTLNILGVYMVPMSQRLGCAPGDFALWVTVAALTSIITNPIWGRLLQTANINLVTSIGALLFVIATLLQGFVTAVWQSWILGFLIGLAWAPFMVMLTPTLINNWFAPHLRGRYLGFASMFTGFGVFVWSPFFTFIMQTFDLQVCYIINAVIMACLLLPFTLFVFKYKPEDKGLKPYGYDPNKSSEDASMQSGMSASKAMKTVPFWLIFCMFGLMTFGMGYNNNQPAIAAEFLAGFMEPDSLQMFGAMMISVGAVANIVGKITIGWLIDKLGLLKALVIFFIIFLGMPICWAFWHTEAGMMVGAFCLGTHNALVAVAFPILVRKLFGAKDYAKIYGRLGMANSIVNAIASAAFAYLAQATGTFMSVVMAGFVIVIGAAVFAFVSASFIGKLKWDNTKEALPENA